MIVAWSAIFLPSAGEVISPWALTTELPVLQCSGAADAHDLGRFVGADESAGSRRIVRVDIQWRLDRLAQGRDHRDLQVADRVDAVGAQAFEQLEGAGIALAEVSGGLEDDLRGRAPSRRIWPASHSMPSS